MVVIITSILTVNVNAGRGYMLKAIFIQVDKDITIAELALDEVEDLVFQ